MRANTLVCLCLVILISGSCDPASAREAPTAVIANDNRTQAGVLRGGVLTVRLEIAEGLWHPESDEGFAVPVFAFREAGKSLQNPGPMIRVQQGTEIQASIHNALAVAVIVHGFHERPGKQNDGITLQPGASQEIRFRAGIPGTYYYWATTTGSPITLRKKSESQLSGALVIDPPNSIIDDRIFVITIWDQDPEKLGAEGDIVAINGKSWPYTERLTFRRGDEVRWRWLNPGSSGHAMHLHGFYFRLEGVGDGVQHRIFSEETQPLLVTHHVLPGETFDMKWIPERSGRWLFHCHMLAHMSPPILPPELQSGATHTNTSHGSGPDHAGMGGIVLGITVLDKEGDRKEQEWKADRKLQLIVKLQEGPPAYSLEVRDLAQSGQPSPASAHKSLIGPPIVLQRGQPVEIDVINQTNEPTAIHWHGIELESYYDGVPGWTGTTQQTTPAIPPGQSFVARMAPPRAGTFIYHTHWHDRLQLLNGIYGPLIVLPAGQSTIAQNDLSFVFSMGLVEPFGPVLLINGHPQPPPLSLKINTKYRFRMINIAPDQAGMRTSLLRSGNPVQWRIVAKDGADLPDDAAVMTKADSSITVGETFDFEYEAEAPEELTLEVHLPRQQKWARQALVFAAPSMP